MKCPIRDLCILHNQHEAFCPSVITVTINPHRFERATFPLDLDSRYFFSFSAISVPATPSREGNSPQRWRDLAATIGGRNRAHHLSVALTIGSLSQASSTAGFLPAGEDGTSIRPAGELFRLSGGFPWFPWSKRNIRRVSGQ